jgi:hypothetical protein
MRLNFNDWQPFLTRWSKQILELDQRFSTYFGTPEISPQVAASDWLGNPPANQTEISLAQERLGLNLPPSYRQFLSLTNRWNKPTLSGFDLWPVHQLDWFSAKLPDYLRNTFNSQHFGDQPALPSYEEPFDLQQVTQAQLEQLLVIGGSFDGQLFLLDPRHSNEEGEWEAWYVDNPNYFRPTFRRYPSFDRLLQQTYHDFKQSYRLLCPSNLPQTDHQPRNHDYDWAALLTEWSSRLLALPASAREDFHYYEEDDASTLLKRRKHNGWRWYRGASEVQILELEQRLGTNLPPSYRQFLKNSNGLPFHQNLLMEVLPTQEVNWFAEEGYTLDYVRSWFNQIPFEKPASEQAYLDYANQEGYCFEPEHLAACLRIGDYDGNDYYLLNPLVVNQAGEWEAWTWLKEGGAQRYPSFWEMMQAIYYSTFLIR